MQKQMAQNGGGVKKWKSRPLIQIQPNVVGIHNQSSQAGPSNSIKI